MTDVTHNPDQVMAWRQPDLDALIGKNVKVQVASDPSYWKNPYHYSDPWQQMGAGVVAEATMDGRGENVHLVYTDGTSVFWIAGQPVYVTVTDPKENNRG